MDEDRLLRRQLNIARTSGLTDLPCNERSEQPQPQQWRCGPDRLGPTEHQHEECHRSQDRREPHRPIAAKHIVTTFTFGVAGSLPFQHSLARVQHSHAGSHNGIRAEVRLIREEDDGQHGLSHTQAKPAGDGTQVRRERQVDRLPKQCEQRHTDVGDQHDPDNDARPDPRGRKRQPADQQHQCQRGWNDAAAQVVENLPAGEQTDWVASGLAVEARHERQQPTGDLPIASNPAMSPTDIRAIPRRVVLIDMNIADQTRPCITAFQQVMAEDLILGKPPLHREGEGVHVIDPLADE